MPHGLAEQIAKEQTDSCGPGAGHLSVLLGHSRIKLHLHLNPHSDVINSYTTVVVTLKIKDLPQTGSYSSYFGKSGFTGSLCASNPPVCTLDSGFSSQNGSWLPKDDKVLAGHINKMMGGSETVGGDKDGVHNVAVHVPIGWQRKVEGGQVIYVSPSGTGLSTLDEVKTYLVTDGTCKCGLECPLIIHKVFNFSVGVRVEQRSQLLGKTEQDMTKLCNHRRKVVAMAALCRSMQASQLPFANFHHPDLVRGDGRDPKGEHVEHKDEGRGISHPKYHSVPARLHNNLHSNPCISPKSSKQFIYPQNGSSPVLHTGTTSHHHLDALRRLHHPLLPTSSTSSSSSPNPSQRSPCTPTPQNINHSQRTPKTPETPSSPRLGPLSPPPPSSPKTLGGGARGAQTHTHSPCAVIVGAPPLSPSPSISPSVHNVCASPHQRSRHLSASPSSASEHGARSDGRGQIGSSFPQRRKSASSSSHSPVPGGSPNRSPHFPKYKLEDILEQFKNSGNSSTNNHLFLNPTNPSLLANQSSSNPHAISSKSSKNIVIPTVSAGSPGFGLNPAGSSSLPLRPLLNHHYSHQAKLPHPASFPASSLLSAAAKAQLANQTNQSQSTNVTSNKDMLKEAQQQQKVTNSTLQSSHTPSSITSAALPHPSLPVASAVLFPSPQTLAQSLVSSLPLPPPAAERSALHRKRQRRSPTVLSMLRDTQQLANGSRKSPAEEAHPAALLNFSSSQCSSTSGVQTQSAGSLENHHLNFPAQLLRLPAPRPTAQLSKFPRPNEAADFTPGLTPALLGLDPPSQPLSALLHLLSVQNAQAASASNPTSAQSRTLTAEVGGHTNKHSLPSPPPSSNDRHSHTQYPADNTNPQAQHPLASPSSLFTSHSPSQSTKSRCLERDSPLTADSHVPIRDSVSRASSQGASPQRSVVVDSAGKSTSASADLSVPVGTPSSPKPLDLSNHVLALLAATSTVTQGEGNSSNANDVKMSPSDNRAGAEETEFLDLKASISTKPAAVTNSTNNISHHEENHNHQSPPAVGDSASPLPLAEAFPFMNQEQLLQLLSSTGGLPSLLDPTILASLPFGGLWLGGQQVPMPPATVPPQPAQNFVDQQQSEPELVMQDPQQPDQDHQQKHQINSGSLFPLLPFLSGIHGELPLNLLGLLNPLPSSVGQDPDLIEKTSLQSLLMASVLLGQQQASLLPLSSLGQVSLEVPMPQSQQMPTSLEGLALEKNPSLLDSSNFLEIAQGLLPITSGSEGPLQALQSLLFPATLPPPPAAFLPLNPALLSAALSSAELHAPPNTQLAPAHQTQHSQPQVSNDSGVDTLIPLSIQAKDNPILQQLLPTLLNPSIIGELPAMAGLQNLVGIGAGSILLSPVQASALNMSLLQSPDGAINLLNNIQLNLGPSDGEKPESAQEAQSPQEDVHTTETTPEVIPSPFPALTPSPADDMTPPINRGSEGKSVIDPYTSFMDTIYTSFLQVSAKEQEDGAQLGPSDPSSPFCALPPVSFPMEPTAVPTLPQANAPVSLSPRRACSLHNPDLSRLSLEAASRSPAQGAPKPTEDGSVLPLQPKPVSEGRTHPEPPVPPPYLEEAKTDCAGPAAAGPGNLPHAGDGCSGQIMDQPGPAGGARRGRKRKQTLQNVLKDFRDMDVTALEETKATTVLLKPERSARGRRRRGTRSQRQ